IEIPEGDGTKRHILIDFGNVLGTAGGQDSVFEPVIDELIAVLGGEPLDLYVMTHEHLDHVQGLLYASRRLNKSIAAKQVWLTGSAAPDYYTTHPDARKQKIAALAAYRAARLAILAMTVKPAGADVLLANNSPSSTADCIDFLRTSLAAAGDVHYVDRTT